MASASSPGTCEDGVIEQAACRCEPEQARNRGDETMTLQEARAANPEPPDAGSVMVALERVESALRELSTRLDRITMLMTHAVSTNESQLASDAQRAAGSGGSEGANPESSTVGSRPAHASNSHVTNVVSGMRVGLGAMLTGALATYDRFFNYGYARSGELICWLVRPVVQFVRWWNAPIR